MGVVIRQGLKSTAVQYLGVIVGAVSNLLLVTQLEAEYGLVVILIASANLVAPFAMMGSYGIAVRYFPYFQDHSSDRKGFLTLVLGIATVGSVIYLALSPWIQDVLIEPRFADTDESMHIYMRYVPILTVLFVFTRVLVQYISNLRRIVIPNLLEQFAFKLTLPALLALYLFDLIPLAYIVYGVLIHYALVLLGLVVYLASLGGLGLGKVTTDIWAKRKAMSGFAAYGIAGQLGGMLAFRIDVFMVGAYLGLAAAGKYALALFLAEIIAKPFSNLRAVVGPMVASAWQRQDFAELQSLYRKSSDNLMLAALYLYGGVWVCFDSVAQLASKPSTMLEVVGVFFFLGLARVVDSATSINEHLITYSPRYRFNLWAILLLAGLNLGMNAWLIPQLGVVGAALATLTSISLYNALKVGFAFRAFSLWPFGKTSLLIAVIGLAAIAAVYFLPQTDVWWIDILSRGGMLTVCFYLLVWYGRPSPEARSLVAKVLRGVGFNVT